MTPFYRSGPEILSRMCHPGSSRPYILQDTGPSQPPIRLECRLVGSMRWVLWLSSRSPRTCRASWWGFQVTPERCTTLGVFCSWLPCPMGICGLSSCIDVFVGPLLTLLCTLCTRFLMWSGMGHRRPWAAGSWGPRWRYCTLHTAISVRCICIVLYSLMLAPSILGRVPFGLGQAGGWRRFRILVHIVRAGGWGWGGRYGLCQGWILWTPHSLSGVDGSPWWQRSPAWRSDWVVRG